MGNICVLRDCYLEAKTTVKVTPTFESEVRRVQFSDRLEDGKLEIQICRVHEEEVKDGEIIIG